MRALHLPSESLPPWLHGSVKFKSFKCCFYPNKSIPTSILAGKKQHEREDPDFTCPTKPLGIKHITNTAPTNLYLHDMKRENHLFLKKYANLAVAMVSLAENGCVQCAASLWDDLLYSSLRPSIHLVSSLLIAYTKSGNFNQISTVLSQIRDRDFIWLPQAYSLSISCFGIGGRLDLMESTLNEMVSMGFRVDSATANAYVVYYSKHGTLVQMEAAYGRLKRSRILIEEEGIRAMSFAYMKEKKFYKLGEFLRDVGLGRRSVGNLLWNLLLLSYAVNFKMKSLQREFLGMLEAGFRPDLTSFNIRALAFSRMNLFWDLHLSLEHMRHDNVVPDLVTYGCVVDAYLEKRMGRNLDFALKKMVNLDECPSVATDPFVFEVMGKGDFHLASEAFLEFNQRKRWTYRKLIEIYLKRQYRSNQILWNY